MPPQLNIFQPLRIIASASSAATKKRRRPFMIFRSTIISALLLVSCCHFITGPASAVDYGALIVGRCQATQGNGRCVASGDSCRIVGGIIGRNPILNETLEDGQIPFRGRASPLPVWNCLPHEVCCIIPALAQPNACSTCGVMTRRMAAVTSSMPAIQIDRSAAQSGSHSVDDDDGDSSTLAPLKLRTTLDSDNERGLQPRSSMVRSVTTTTASWCWHAALVDRHSGSVFGSAVLIAQAWLLTVAHKLRNRTPADFFVVLGERDFGMHNDDSRVALVRDVFVHPEFNMTTFANDIALLRVNDAPCNGKNICTVCLGNVDDIAQDDDEVGESENVPASLEAMEERVHQHSDEYQHSPSDELQARRAALPPLDKMYGLNREFRSLQGNFFANNNNNMQQRPLMLGRSDASPFWNGPPPMAPPPAFLQARSMFRPAPPRHRILQATARQLMPNNNNGTRELTLGSAIPAISVADNGQQAPARKQQITVSINNNGQQQQQQRGTQQQAADVDALLTDYYNDGPDSDIFNGYLGNGGVRAIADRPVTHTGETILEDFKPLEKDEYANKYEQALRPKKRVRNNEQQEADSDSSSSIKVYMNRPKQRPNERRRIEAAGDYYGDSLSEPSTATLKAFGPRQLNTNRNFRARSQSVVNDWLAQQREVEDVQQQQRQRHRQRVELSALGSGRNSLRQQQTTQVHRQRQSAPKPSIFSRCVVTGWGASSRNTTRPPRVQQSSVELRGNVQCLQDMRREQVTANAVPPTMVCARGADRTPLSMCEGDGGGPLVCQLAGTDVWYLEGLAALGASVDCETKTTAPSMYVRVGLYRDWIEKSLIAFLEQQQQQQQQQVVRR